MLGSAFESYLVCVIITNCNYTNVLFMLYCLFRAVCIFIAGYSWVQHLDVGAVRQSIITGQGSTVGNTQGGFPNVGLLSPVPHGGEGGGGEVEQTILISLVIIVTLHLATML